MKKYLLQATLSALVSMLAVSAIVFFIVRLTGNPIDLLISDYATPQERQELAQTLGMDKPIWEQYGMFIWKAVQGDFGKSIKSSRPALDLVMERLPASLQLGSVAMLVSILIAVPAGVYAARHRGKWLDVVVRAFAILGQATPSFWLGLILIYIFAVTLGWLPTAGRTGITSVVLPAVTMGWYGAAGIARLTRSSMLDVLDSEYVKLARAKGLAERLVIWKHAFRNAAIPLLTFTVMLFVVVIGGAVVTETVFAWPGVGRLVVDAVRSRDFPVVQAVVMLLSAMYISANFFADILYGLIHPKIRYR